MFSSDGVRNKNIDKLQKDLDETKRKIQKGNQKLGELRELSRILKKAKDSLIENIESDTLYNSIKKNLDPVKHKILLEKI